MAGDPDDTVLIPRPGTRRSLRPAGRHWLAVAAAVALLGASGAAWFAWRAAPTVAPSSTAGAPAPPLLQASTQTTSPTPTPAVLPPLATEAEILARSPDATEAYRFALQPEIVVLQFPTLAEQARSLNRAAALVERAGFPHDSVLEEAEVNRRFIAAGDTPDRVYYGHDYRASDLLRFFDLAERAGTALTPEEQRLRQMMRDWGWRPGTNGALISLVRADPAAGVNDSMRATILRHELSHGLYFVAPAYAKFAQSFWDTTLDPAERDRFRAFLANEGYDTALDDLVVNEMQAYLMHTADERFFSAAAIGLPQARIDALRALFLTGMPPGWLRDCTVLPARVLPANASSTAAPLRTPRRRPQRRGAVRTGRTVADTRPPLRTAAARASRRSRA